MRKADWANEYNTPSTPSTVGITGYLILLEKFLEPHLEKRNLGKEGVNSFGVTDLQPDLLNLTKDP